MAPTESISRGHSYHVTRFLTSKINAPKRRIWYDTILLFIQYSRSPLELEAVREGLKIGSIGRQLDGLGDKDVS